VKGERIRQRQRKFFSGSIGAAVGSIISTFRRERKAPEERNIYRIKASSSIPTLLFKAQRRRKEKG